MPNYKGLKFILLVARSHLKLLNKEDDIMKNKSKEKHISCDEGQNMIYPRR